MEGLVSDISVPLVLMEEHHEAFFLWNYAMGQGWIPERGNTLLHVDSHSDMVLPILRCALPKQGNLHEIQRFTYSALDISTFILPAVFQRIFNRVLYLRHEHPVSASGWRRLAVELDTEGRMRLRTRTQSVFDEGPSVRSFNYTRVTPRLPIDTDQPITLDVDLDYFCTNENPVPLEPEIETTREVHEEMQSNPYALPRLIPRMNITSVERQGRYYLVFYDSPAPEVSLEGQLKMIETRMADFMSSLRKSSVRPVLISVCRSRYSGYTPARVVSYIEEYLLRELAKLYSFDCVNLQTLLPTRDFRQVLQTCSPSQVLG